MSSARRLRRTASGALLSCVSALLLAGCAHHRGDNIACREPEFNGVAQNLPPLGAPPGLNAPNTSGGVHVPAANSAPAAPARARNAPCLDWPPTYVSEPPVPPTRRAAPAANPTPGANPGPEANPAAGAQPGAGSGPNPIQAPIP